MRKIPMIKPGSIGETSDQAPALFTCEYCQRDVLYGETYCYAERKWYSYWHGGYLRFCLKCAVAQGLKW